MKNIIKKVILLLSLACNIIFLSCDKDIVENELYHERIKQNISFEQFKKETGISNFSPSIKIPVSDVNSLSKAVSLEDFTIELETVLKLINETNKITYSFKIIPTSSQIEDKNYNLVYRKVAENWEYSILTFEENKNFNGNYNEKFSSFQRLFDSALNNSTLSMMTEICISISYSNFHCTNSGDCLEKGYCDLCHQCCDWNFNVYHCGPEGGSQNDGSSNSGLNGGNASSDAFDPYDFTPNDGSTTFQETPCNSIKKLTKDDEGNLKPSIDWLKTKVTEKLEFGVEVKKNLTYEGTYNYTKNHIQSTEQYNVPLKVGGSHIGSCHSHPINSYAIPSLGDLQWILDCYDKANGDYRRSDVFSMIVCKAKDGTINVYCLKINDIENLRNEVNAVWNDQKYSHITDERLKLDKIHLEEATKYSKNENELEKLFLQKYGSFGVDLYKASGDSLNQWDKLELGANPDTSSPNQLIVIPNPC